MQWTGAKAGCPVGCRWLQDSHSDFRLGSTALQATRFAVFGCGNSLYGSNFNRVARCIDDWLHGLGGRRLMPCRLGDEDGHDMTAQFDAWMHQVSWP